MGGTGALITRLGCTLSSLGFTLFSLALSTSKLRLTGHDCLGGGLVITKYGGKVAGHDHEDG